MARKGPRPVFEHRHFVAVAAILAEALKRECSDLDKVEVVERLRIDFTNAFARDNSNFDRVRFVAAAKGNPTTGRDRP